MPRKSTTSKPAPSTPVAPSAPAPIPAALYLRMSDDEQETSIPNQRAEMIPWAEANGYKIIREYVDEGISAFLGDGADRKDFLRMVADSANGDFQAILVVNTSRFGRLDPIKAAKYK